MLKFSFSIGAAIALFAVAAPSNAVIVTSAFGPTDPGSPGETLLVDFNNGATLPDGYTLTGNPRFATTTVKDYHAIPAGDKTQYMYVSTRYADATATLSTFDLSSLSFYWGSIDKFNSVDLILNDGKTFHYEGGMLPPSNGNQAAADTNRRVFFTTELGETIQGIKFTSKGVAFEVDDIYGKLASDGSPGGGGTVPEPASWALMIMGFGLVGFASRRRNRAMTSVTA